jgi:GH24 family phage-related lysozyme (muramidase)
MSSAGDVPMALEKPPDDESSFEREKWRSDLAFRERELALKEKGHEVALTELQLKQAEQQASRWKSPLIVAIFAAAVAGISNAFLSYLSSETQTKLETQKSEQLRILEMIKTGDPDKAANNLRFLLEAGLIRDALLRGDLQRFLNTRKPGTGPTLPTTGFVAKDAPQLLSKFEGTILKVYKDPTGSSYIGSGHRLTKEELEKGVVKIGGEDVSIEAGLTEQQAQRLLQQDLQPIREQVEELVKVPLSVEQREALVSFVWNVGIGTFKGSSLLAKLNEGRYEEVPNELRRWTRVGGVALPGLEARREAEISLWKRPTK